MGLCPSEYIYFVHDLVPCTTPQKSRSVIWRSSRVAGFQRSRVYSIYPGRLEATVEVRFSTKLVTHGGWDSSVQNDRQALVQAEV